MAYLRSAPTAAAPRAPNYITPQGYDRLKAELLQLLDVERPALVKVIAWAASNGDRSENADYLFGKKRLREIDRRIRHLTLRLDSAAVVDPATRVDTEQIFFGATVTYRTAAGDAYSVSIVGIDEADAGRGRVSWISPIARALLKRRAGDTVWLQTPAGEEEFEILHVQYRPLP